MGRSIATACASPNRVGVGYVWTWLLILLAGASLPVAGASPAPQPTALNGILDARSIDFGAADIDLNGTWKWYWNELRPPGQPETGFEYVAFPRAWAGSTWHTRPIPSQGFATYTLTVLLPARPGPLLLELPDQYSAYRLFVNGKTVAQDGTPGRSKAATTPYWSTQLVALPDTGRTLHLLLQVANFHHSKGGPNKPLRLGNADRFRQRQTLTQAGDFFLAGCLFMGGLFFLGLFAFGRNDRAILYFSLFCLFYSYRIVGAEQYTLHTVFTSLSWFVAIRLEYLSLFLGVGVFVLYTRSLYPDDTHPVFMKSMAGICFALAACVVLFPPVVFTQLINPFLGLLFVYIGYAFYIYTVAAHHHRPGARYALMSTALLLTVALMVILKYFGVATPDRAALFLGYIGFFFLQSLILSFRFAYTLKQAKDQAESGLKAKSEFLSIMSHEIRTPLNAVIGMTYLLQEDQPRPDQRPHLDTLLFSAKNLLNIVNDILDFSKIEAGKFTIETIPFDLKAIVQGVVATYRSTAAEKPVELRLVLDPTLTMTLLGDPTRLAQVLGNLVQNAIKFTQQGWVELRVRVETRTESHLTVAFAVEDTGIGIAPEKQALIFSPFTQADASMSRSFGGTGLGLAICKTILERQGVTLHLASEPDRGATFSFTQTFTLVPEKVPAVPEPVAKPDNGQKPLAGLSVLLVEDYPMNVLFAKGLLQRLGATVEVATNGQEALDLLDATRHHVVLMDLQMPVMDGYESTRQMRRRGETLPIIALTAGITNGQEDDVWTNGLDDVLLKPFTPDSLIGMIRRHVKPAER